VGEERRVYVGAKRTQLGSGLTTAPHGLRDKDKKGIGPALLDEGPQIFLTQTSDLASAEGFASTRGKVTDEKKNVARKLDGRVRLLYK
jgi:hypothetical protein